MKSGALLMRTPGSNGQQTVQTVCETWGLLPVAIRRLEVARLANSGSGLPP